MNRQEFIQANKWYHKINKKANGEPVEVRRNGKTKLWKTRPEEFQIPVKQGLNTCGYLTQENMHSWDIA